MPLSPEHPHQRKKLIQRSISTYLEPVDLHAESKDCRPQLPKETQSMLITVGMRVRKSVPEGYKTEEKEQHSQRQTCGLHNIGGIPQEQSFSSQSSVSTQSSFSSADSRKRLCEDDNCEDAMDLIFEQQEKQIQSRPKMNARSRRGNDFEDAAFLRPQEELDLG